MRAFVRTVGGGGGDIHRTGDRGKGRNGAATKQKKQNGHIISAKCMAMITVHTSRFDPDE